MATCKRVVIQSLELRTASFCFIRDRCSSNGCKQAGKRQHQHCEEDKRLARENDQESQKRTENLAVLDSTERQIRNDNEMCHEQFEDSIKIN